MIHFLKIQHIFRIASIVICLGYAASLFASDDIDALLTSINASLDQQGAFQMGMSENIPYAIKFYDVLLAFKEIDRAHVETEALIEARYHMQFWRRRTADFLIELSDQISKQTDQYREILVLLQDLHLRLAPEELARVASNLPEAGLSPTTLEWLVNLYAMHGADGYYAFQDLGLSLPSGFDVKKFGPVTTQTELQADINGKAINIEDIIATADFSNYTFTKNGVFYAGHEFQTGDILLIEHNDAFAGSFGIFFDPPGYLTHFAFVAILEHEGARFPVVVDIYKSGIRATPLYQYLSANITGYLEIYRMPDVTDVQRDKLVAKVNQVVREPYHFDFFFDGDADPKTVTCPEVGTTCFNPSGFPKVTPNSRLAAKYSDNLIALGVTEDILDKTLLSSNDYLQIPGIQLVGVIDNNFLAENAVRKLILRRVGELFENQALDLGNMGFKFKVYAGGAKHIQLPTIRGFIFRKAEGFKLNNAPQGPGKLMGMAGMLDDEGYKMLEQPEYAELINYIHGLGRLSFENLYGDSYVQQQVKKLTENIASWFSAPQTP